MPKKKISICQDETFHPDICLVAMEPVSNFILLEKYDKKRDAKRKCNKTSDFWAVLAFSIEVVIFY